MVLMFIGLMLFFAWLADDDEPPIERRPASRLSQHTLDRMRGEGCEIDQESLPDALD